jgi:hypothetical protein
MGNVMEARLTIAEATQSSSETVFGTPFTVSRVSTWYVGSCASHAFLRRSDNMRLAAACAHAVTARAKPSHSQSDLPVAKESAGAKK